MQFDTDFWGMLLGWLGSFSAGYIGVKIRSRQIEKDLEGNIIKAQSSMLDIRTQLITIGEGVDNLNQKFRKKNWEIFPPANKDELDRN